MVTLMAQKLKVFQERSLVAFLPFAIFLDTIYRGGEAFLIVLGVDVNGRRVITDSDIAQNVSTYFKKFVRVTVLRNIFLFKKFRL
jgi:transposase-like protein